MTEEELLQGAKPVTEEELLASATPVQQDKTTEPTKLEALGMGIARGAGLGWSDRLEAGAKAAAGKGDYDALLSDIRQRNENYDRVHPVVSGIGKVLGGAVPFVLGGELLGAGGAAAEGAGAAAEAGSTLGGTLGLGAGAGAVEGLGETEDLSKNFAQDLKNTATGAATGAVSAAALHGLVKSAGAIKDRLVKTDMADRFMRNYDTGSVAGSAARTEARAGSLDASKDLITKINDLEDTLTGKFDKTNKVTIPGEYDNLFEKANNANPAGIDIKPVIQKYIADLGQKAADPTEAPFLQQMFPVYKEQIQNLSNAANENWSPSKVHSEILKLNKMYNKSGDNKPEMLLNLAGHLKDSLNESMEKAGLGEDFQTLESKYKRVKELKDLLGIKPEADANPGSSQGRAALKASIQNVADTFEGANYKDPDKMIELKKAADMMEELHPDGAAVLDPVNEAAKRSVAGYEQNRESPLSVTAKNAHLAGKSLEANLGAYTGDIARGIQNKASAITDFGSKLLKGASGELDKNPEAVDNLASQLLASDDSTKQQVGGLLKKIVSEPSVTKKRALMFSLSQQPAFRKAIGSHFANILPGVEEP